MKAKSGRNKEKIGKGRRKKEQKGMSIRWKRRGRCERESK